jgi:hypothetical protein
VLTPLVYLLMELVGAIFNRDRVCE